MPAAVAGSFGIIFLWLLAPRIIPKREQPLKDSSPRIFAAQLSILEGSAAEGKTVAEAIKMTDGAIKIKNVKRGPDNFILPFPSVVLRAGDQLIVRDTPERLKEFEKVLEATLYPEGSEDKPVSDGHPLQAKNQQVASLKTSKDFLVLDATTDLPFARKAPLALLIMVGIVATAAFGLLPIAISAPCGALLMIVTGCLEWRDATAALSAQVILIVAASLALGVALLKTGAADYLARLFVALVGDTSPRFVVSGLMLLQ